VELRGAQHTRGDRARPHRPLVGELRGAVAGGELVGPDDGHHDHPLHAGPLACVVEVPGCGGEELGGRVLVG
jgi:hypothetical protein